MIGETRSRPTNGVGAALRWWRVRSCLSLREVSRAAGISHPYLLRLETGVKAGPSDSLRPRLGEALQLDERERKILELLAEYPETKVDMVERVLARDVPYELLFTAVMERKRWAA